MKNNEFEMMLDSYMEGYDEGKDDDVVLEEKIHKQKHVKNVVLLRRKKGHWKSKARMGQIATKSGAKLTRKSEQVLVGMLRSHQIAGIGQYDDVNHFDSSVGNKKRNDAAMAKLKEAKHVQETLELEMA